MVGTIEEDAFDADHGVASENADCHGGLETSINGWNVFTRNTSTSYLVIEFVDLVALNLKRLE